MFTPRRLTDRRSLLALSRSHPDIIHRGSPLASGSKITVDKKRGALVSSERLVLDGTLYNINVYVKNGIYRATWYCGACSDRSDVAYEDRTISGAASICKSYVAQHHANKHAR